MKSSITLEAGRLVVDSGYSPILVERFRQIEGRRWDADRKVNSFPATGEALLAVCDVMGLIPWMLDDDVKALLDTVAKPPEARPVDVALAEGHSFLTPPFDHQRVNFARLMGENRWVLADEMGTGKSFSLVNKIRTFVGDATKVLIICPKPVAQGWVKQLNDHGQLGCEVIEGSKERREAVMLRHHGKPSIKITNYELLLHSDFSVVSWDIIVLDEIHKVKNHSSQVSKRVRELTEKASHVYGLSGTPAPNGLEDWFGVLRAVKPDLLPVTTKTAFEARYCLKTKLPDSNVFKISGYKNVAELHGYIASITSRVTKAECLDLPGKMFETRTVTLDGDQARIYRDLKRDAVARLADTELSINNVLQESLRLLQVVGGFMPGDDGTMAEIENKAKLPALAGCLDELGTKRCVIWCNFLAEVRFLAKWLGDSYGRTVTFCGETSEFDRIRALEDFVSGKARYFLGTAGAGGTGINGLEVCDTEIYYSRGWRYDHWVQSQDRLDRIGQKNKVTVIKLVASGTVDEKVDLALEKKGGMQDMMLQRPEDFF